MSAKGSTPRLPLRKLRPAAPLQPRPAMIAKVVKKTRAKNACLPCQQSKKKCSEERPLCAACVEAGLECLYSVEDTARHKRTVLHKKIKDYETDIEKYEQVLEHIKTSGVPALHRVLNVISDQAPLEDIMLFIRNEESSYPPIGAISPEPATSDLSLLMNEQWESLQSQGFLNTELVDDRPILNLAAAPWTTVTDNDELVSHPMSLYMTWDDPVWHLFDFDILIDAMKYEDLTYCSPLLVNATLAEACHYSNRIRNRSDPHDHNFLGYRFFQEAMRLWNEETSREPTLLTVQSAFMGGFQLPVVGEPWPHTMPPPKIPLPYLESAVPRDYIILPGEEPLPHPIQHDLETGPFRDPNLITEWYPYPEKSLTITDKKRFYELFDDWKNTLPKDLREGKCISPGATFIHAWYHAVIMDIHQSTLRDLDKEDPADVAIFKADSLSRYNRSRNGLYIVLDTYHRRNSMLTMTQPFTFALLLVSQNATGSLAKIKGLETATSAPESASDKSGDTGVDREQIPRGPYDEDHILEIFENTLIWACHASRSFVTIKVFVRLMQLEAQRLNIELSDRVLENLRPVFQWDQEDRGKWIEDLEKTQTSLTWRKKKTEANIVDMVKTLEQLSV
ncbi:hypothetical protein Dda_9242 [Drechslerella dactyloides]|uniref:Zn(2)-C6 fungal-type domain-containing protein n=1 Tax=Drechslerella dactyloides TaxID=74499 RepID=A0AAD6IPN3_DREDA|nr:hypothetical protein Dda_9242 [Drechslerella dactyloides]